LLTTIAPTRTHDEDLESALGFDDVGCDCVMCHTRATRACDCGGRVHNEMHEEVVEMCFSCDIDWIPVANGSKTASYQGWDEY